MGERSEKIVESRFNFLPGTEVKDFFFRTEGTERSAKKRARNEGNEGENKEARF